MLAGGLDRVARLHHVGVRVAHRRAVDVKALDTIERQVAGREALGQVGEGLTVADLRNGGANAGDEDANLVVVVGHVVFFLLVVVGSYERLLDV